MYLTRAASSSLRGRSCCARLYSSHSFAASSSSGSAVLVSGQDRWRDDARGSGGAADSAGGALEGCDAGADACPEPSRRARGAGGGCAARVFGESEEEGRVGRAAIDATYAARG